MAEIGKSMHSEAASDVKSPPDKLYIYYLKGRVRADLLAQCPDCLGNWEEEGLSFLFFSSSADHKVQWLLSAQPELDLIDRFESSYFDWQGGDFPELKVGGLEILPAWRSSKDGLNANSIYLDPGVVFGNGNHGTTRDCLDALAQVMREERIEFVQDLGAGTGILSLAAAKLGARQVVAVDLNPLAVKTARENIFLNRLENKVLAVQGRAEDFIDQEKDLLLANLHYDVLSKLAEDLGFLRAKYLILSGLLRSQAEKIEKALKAMPVKILKHSVHDNIWHTFTIKVTSQ